MTSLARVAAAATSIPTSAVLTTRIFKDCPESSLATGNSYPTSIFFDDAALDCAGYANLHNWRFSGDGVNPMVFANDDEIAFSAGIVISGASGGEAGLLLSPWWSLNVEGRCNVRVPDGEIACFGGRLPFYSFTANHGIVYAQGNRIRLEIIYRPDHMTPASPATIEYRVTYLAPQYRSGQLAFDRGNPAEDPPHGQWGMLTPAGAGGYLQAFLVPGDRSARVQADFSNMQFSRPVQVPDLSRWGVAVLVLLLVGAETNRVRRRRRPVS